MDEHAPETDTPASASSSPLSSTHSSRSPSPERPSRATRDVAPPLKKALGYWWREEEIILFEELVAEYGHGPIDWAEVASELARQCPMDPAPARTARQCAARRWNYLSRATDASPPQPWTDQTKAALAQAVRAKLGNSTRNPSKKEWEVIGKDLKPKRSGAAAREMFRKLGGGGKSVAGSSRSAGSTTPPGAGNPVSSQVPSKRTTSDTSTQVAQASALVSAVDRPFSPEDDEELLELYRLKGPAYKAISRSLDPQRHKGEVTERFEYLLQPYDFSTFFPSPQSK